MRFGSALFILTATTVMGATIWLWSDLFFPRSHFALPHPFGQCAAIDDVSPRPWGDRDFSGRRERAHRGAFDEVDLFDKDGSTHATVREQWGGSLIYFGSQTNTLDASQPNRGLHVGLFDDAHPNSDCADSDGLAGWAAEPSSNVCGDTRGLDGPVEMADGLTLTTTPLLFNPYGTHHCRELNKFCSDGSMALRSTQAQVRISESFHFVRAGVLEVDVQATNLSDHDLTAIHSRLDEWPTMFAALGGRDDIGLAHLKNAAGEDFATHPRTPAGAISLVRDVGVADGWATWQNASDSAGLAILWENQSSHVRLLVTPNERHQLTSQLPISIPPGESVRGRFYLFAGGFNHVHQLAEELNHSMPAFGRIEVNTIADDTRTVSLSGWALDNRGIAKLELWVDGTKTSDLNLSETRDDVCQHYPGYQMCETRHARVGFLAQYPRPKGSGCDRIVEVRAQDTDGNWRTIARRGIAPVQ